MAAHQTGGRRLGRGRQLRAVRHTACGGVAAARSKQATRRTVVQARHHPGNGGQAPIGARLLGHGRQQGLGIRVLRRGKQAGDRTFLDHLAGIHHGHAVRHLLHDAHVVRNEDQRHAALALQFAQKLKNLRLNGDIQRRRGLVGNQKARVAGDGHGDHHALVHAARHLVRVIRQTRRRSRNAHLLQKFDRARARGPLVQRQMQAQRFHKLKTHREAGVETGRRVLEDHGNVFADELAPLAIGQAEQILAIKLQVLGTHAARIGDESHQRHHAHALA